MDNLQDTIEALLKDTDEAMLHRLIHERKQAVAKTQSEAAAKSITTPVEPANGKEICAFVLSKATTADYAQAYVALRTAAQGYLADPPAATWTEVWEALLILPTTVRAACPHLEDKKR